MRDPFQSIEAIDRIDRRIAGWMERHGLRLLRLSLGIIFIWFGGLKLIPGLSPAEALVKATVYWFPPDIFFPILGVWEVLIGVGLLFHPLVRFALLLLFLQMPGTMLPLFMLPEECFTTFPFGLTLEGQYIIKNLVLISAAFVVGGTVRHRKRPDQIKPDGVGPKQAEPMQTEPAQPDNAFRV